MTQDTPDQTIALILNFVYGLTWVGMDATDVTNCCCCRCCCYQLLLLLLLPLLLLRLLLPLCCCCCYC